MDSISGNHTFICTDRDDLLRLIFEYLCEYLPKFEDGTPVRVELCFNFKKRSYVDGFRFWTFKDKGF